MGPSFSPPRNCGGAIRGCWLARKTPISPQREIEVRGASNISVRPPSISDGVIEIAAASREHDSRNAQVCKGTPGAVRHISEDFREAGWRNSCRLLRGEKVSHVLIVDDSEDIRLALRMILEDADYEVKELSDGTEVLNALKTDPPVLVLLDVAMPARNGFDTLKEIIAEKQTRDIPVIMVTAKGRAEDLSRARSLGARDYINKPWEDGEVELRVGWVLKAQDLRAAS